ISGIGRDAEHPRAVVLYLRNEPSEEDMRAIQNFLRAISADVLTQAQHSVPEAKLSDPTAVHQWQFSNAWFDGSEEVVLKAGKEGSPIRTLYAAPPAQAQHGVPEASEQGKEQGWTLDYRFVERVTDLAASRTEYTTSMEATEQVLLAARELLAAAPGKEGL
ncbi:TPA: hypothetical protein ACKQBB_001703, partial [Pseudomonas aeruginosa]